jgi:hypothetical protein
MGKRGKAARKRRRENEVVITTAAADDCLQSDDDSTNDELHGISNSALDISVATLHRLCGLVDPVTGKLALKDKRYRSLRKVIYELQNSSGGTNGMSFTNTCGVVSSLDNVVEHSNPLPSLSKITRELSAQIENGAWEMAVMTLRNIRLRQEEHAKQSNDTIKTAANCNYLRPKLGTLQRWVRQVDAAGTDNPLAWGVLDAILRVVSPETIIPVDMKYIKIAKWIRLGVSGVISSDDGGKQECGSVRMFPPLDLRQKDLGVSQSPEDRPTRDIVDTLVSSLQVGRDGIRQIVDSAAVAQRNVLFRRCGFEKAVERTPPNRYDLEIVTTEPIFTTNAFDGCHPSLNLDTLSGNHMLHENDNTRFILMTPLPYVQDTFFLENVLSPTECDRLIASAELAGYNPDEPLGGQPGESILAHACVWVVDLQLERTIFERVERFLPSYVDLRQRQQDSESVDTLKPLGLNRRFRFYRYVPGRYYRPHIDGAWPPSGFDKEGHYRYDITDETNKNGLQFIEGIPIQPDTFNPTHLRPTVNIAVSRRQLSRLTFLIYLNEDFDGGHTTFLIPAAEEEGVLNAFPVSPVRGGVLVFPHGTCAAPLHEGSPVLTRCKYLVRTEVEYYV